MAKLRHRLVVSRHAVVAVVPIEIRFSRSSRRSSRRSPYSSQLTASTPVAPFLRRRWYATRKNGTRMWLSRLVHFSSGLCLASSPIRCSNVVASDSRCVEEAFRASDFPGGGLLPGQDLFKLLPPVLTGASDTQISRPSRPVPLFR